MINKNIIMNIETNTETVGQTQAKTTSNVWPAVIAAGASLAGSALSSWSNSKNNAANLQLAREQNDWNEQMWNKQNEYNTYQNQLKRWADAGLNPNAFVGENSNAQQLTSSNLANQTADTNTGNILAQGGANVANSLLVSQAQAQQYDIAKQEMGLKQQEIDVQKKLAGLKEKETNQNIKESEKRIDKLVSEKVLTDEQAKNARAMNAQINAQTDVLNETVSNLKKQGALLDFEVAFQDKTFDDRVEQVSAQLNLTKAQMKQALASAANLLKSSELMDTQIELNGVIIDIKKTEGEQLSFDLNFDKEHKEIQWYIDNGLKIEEGLTDLLTLGFGKVAKKFGKGLGAGLSGNKGKGYTPNSTGNPKMGKK